MRIIVIGTSKFTVSCINGLVESNHEIISLMSESKSVAPTNSIDMRGIASDLNIPFHETDDINADNTYEYLAEKKPDLIFSTWSKLISRKILRISKYGIIGTHPTCLPRNRGRHPLHWLIVLGIKKSALSFFIMEEGVDSGPILYQEPFNVENNISYMNETLNNLAYKSSINVGNMLHNKEFIRNKEKQDESYANTWRKRTLFDVTIDFRMSGKDIINLINSFSSPFPGAILLVENNTYHIKSAIVLNKEFDSDEIENIEHGKILYAENNLLRIKAADTVIEIVPLKPFDNIIKDIEYIHPPIKYIVENPSLSSKYMI